MDLEKKPSQQTTAASSSSEDDASHSSKPTTGSPSQRFSTREEQDIATALAAQAFHLPGNSSFWQDFRQYIGNNHPVLSFCCHHKLHPATLWARLLCLLTSAIFGLVLTNIVWLYANAGDKHNKHNLSLTVNVGDTIGQGVNHNATAHAYTQYLLSVDEANQVEITDDMIFLWTVGGALHGCFDNLIWTCTVCTCCSFARLQRYQRYGAGLVTFILLVITAVATLTVVLRVAMENDQQAAADLQDIQSAGLWDDQVDLTSLTMSTNGAQYKEFLIACAAEFWFALWFHYPLVALLLFSGVLNIKGRLPCLGGRPQELRRLEATESENEAAPDDDYIEKGEATENASSEKASKEGEPRKSNHVMDEESAFPDAKTDCSF